MCVFVGGGFVVVVLVFVVVVAVLCICILFFVVVVGCVFFFFLGGGYLLIFTINSMKGFFMSQLLLWCFYRTELSDEDLQTVTEACDTVSISIYQILNCLLDTLFLEE